MNNLSIVHPELGEVGPAIESSVQKATQYHYNRLPVKSIMGWDDLYQAGMIGALQGLSRFDSSKNVKLETFIYYRINGAIKDLLRSLDYINRKNRKALRSLSKRQEETSVELQEGVSQSSVANEMGSDYISALALVSSVTISMTEFDNIASDEIDPEDHVLITSRLERMRSLVSHLPTRDQVIVTLYSQSMSQREIGAMFGISESRVSQLRTRAIEVLGASMVGY